MIDWGGHAGQIAVTVVASLILVVLGLVPKTVAFFVRKIREIRVSRYISATSYDDGEILGAINHYIKPQCMEVDPAVKSELREALVFESSPLFAYVDEFLRKGKAKHLFVFADCGMGKTSFLINYFYRHKTRYFGVNFGMALVSLSRAGAEDEIGRTPPEKRKGTVLLLDALDEDPLVFNDASQRVERILSLTADFRAVIITCRSQFFLSDDVIPVSTGVIRVGPTRASESKEYALKKIYIAPFDDKRIRKYLYQVLPGLINLRRRIAARRIVEKIPFLTVRPMLLAHIVDVMAANEELRTQADIYQAMVSAWVKREEKWVKAKPLLDFSRNLAFDLYLNRSSRGGEFCEPDEITRLAKLWGTDIKTEHLTGRSLLNRLGDGRYKFAHRSILEYFVAKAICSSAPGLSLDITDQIGVFLIEELGLADGHIEFFMTRSPLMVSVVPPLVRAGYATNYGLCRFIEEHVDTVAMFGATVDSIDGLFDACTLGDHLHEAFEYARAKGKFIDARLNISGKIEDAEYLDAYFSLWFDDVVVISKFLISSKAIASSIAPWRGGAGELSFVGTSAINQHGASSLNWSFSARFDTWLDGSLDVRFIERNPSVSFMRSLQHRKLVISVIPGANRSGPLSRFGILGGGSSHSLFKQRFVRMPAAQIIATTSGTTAEPLAPLVPPAERWPTRKR